jgi:expansin (peptidoglycan-binding protein)
MNTEDYAGAAACGACVEVRGPKGTVDIQIVDQCPIGTNPICYKGHIDLNPAAFDQIGDRVAGILPITWKYIPCKVSGGLTYRFKEGSTQYWTAVLVRNHTYALAKVEYRTNNGTYQALQRQDYNYWLDASGMGPGPYTLRVTDIHGQVVEDSGIPLSVGQTITGHASFGTCVR